MLKLLISPLAQGAYFQDLEAVALAEIHAMYPRLTAQVSHIGPLSFIDLTWSEGNHLSALMFGDRPDERLLNAAQNMDSEEDTPCYIALMRLSFVQAIFLPVDADVSAASSTIQCLDLSPRFKLPRALVSGSKYRGKTHEIVTQLGLNLALRYSTARPTSKPSLLDPMAGRGTTLLWAARYGINAVGIEIDKRALEHFQRDTKRQTKLHRLKHKVQQGSLSQGKRSLRFLEFKWPESTSKLIQGDSRHVETLTGGQRFHYLVSDLPYGVQFGGEVRRNPLDLITECAPAWARSLRVGGVMVLIFNTLQPKRRRLLEYLSTLDLEYIPVLMPHRVSESIERDLIVMRKL